MWIPTTKPQHVVLRNEAQESRPYDGWLVADVSSVTRARRARGVDLSVTQVRVYALESGEHVVAQVTRRLGREVKCQALGPTPSAFVSERLVDLAQQLMGTPWSQVINGEVERLAASFAKSVLLGDIDPPSPESLDEHMFPQQDVIIRETSGSRSAA